MGKSSWPTRTGVRGRQHESGDQQTGAGSPTGDVGLRHVAKVAREPERPSRLHIEGTGVAKETKPPGDERESEQATVPMKSEKSPQAIRRRERPAKQINRWRER